MSVYKQYALLKQKLENQFCEIELEVRKIIQKPYNFIPTEEYILHYYKSNDYPSVIFRAKAKSTHLVMTKELIKSQKMKNGVKIVLSAEDSVSRSLIKTNLEYQYSRKIKRQRLQIDPIVEITETPEGGYFLEIEFDLNNENKIHNLLKKWTYPAWPVIKPFETTSKNLARIINNRDWLYSPKADGEHVLIYEDKEYNRVLIHDNGRITDDNNNSVEPLTNIYNVYEAELINNRLYVFDCLILMAGKICNRTYKQRRASIPYERYYIKEVYDNVEDLLQAKFSYPIDGYIIQHNYKNIKYKSKFKATVDLRFKDHKLFLENETVSYRECEENLENNKIYEFDLNLNIIKERPDKISANFKMPYEDHPLENVINGFSIPTLRNFHNNIKELLLEKLRERGNKLLDIGSRNGGDLSKWKKLNFDKVYAVDPEIKFESNNKVISIQDTAQNVYKQLDYNVVSILFVPWDNSFFDIIKNKPTVLAVLQKPINTNNSVFKCETDGVNVNLQIPGTKTAINVNEKVLNYDFKRYEITYTLKNGTKEEKMLQKMYKYYFIH